LIIFDVSMTAAGVGFSGFALVSSAICFSGASSGDFIVAQASRLWGHRASCLVFELLGNVKSAGETPARPTGKMPVLRQSS
jgi:hypothetical protein